MSSAKDEAREQQLGLGSLIQSLVFLQAAKYAKDAAALFVQAGNGQTLCMVM